MGIQGWARPDETQKLTKYKTIRHICYALILIYGILAAELATAIIGVILHAILTELRRHRYQRALIFERERKDRESEQDEPLEEEHLDPDPNIANASRAKNSR